ncbi:hypothetical protein RhiirB3_451987 [Rhizophagus irregularis]|nr:hypothetical protein RhiirB3_451987 [Rhizophagus irregularis]
MTYYNSCVYAASGRKLDENKIIVLDAELENVQIDGFVAHLSDDHSLCWNKDFVPYGRSVQEKIKAKEFEPTFAKHILDFEKIQKCLACEAFPKYSPLGLCRYHEFCLKYGWYQEFPNKQYIPSPQNQNLIANTSTIYDVLVKMFGYQEFRDMQEMAISSYVNGSHTFVLMRTGAGKTMCYWISAILRGESWSKLRKISTLFPSSPIMMLTGTCKESDVHQILENLCLAPNNEDYLFHVQNSQ